MKRSNNTDDAPKVYNGLCATTKANYYVIDASNKNLGTAGAVKALNEIFDKIKASAATPLIAVKLVK